MQAVIVEAFGEAEFGHLGAMPTPDLGPHDVLVEIAAVAVNYVDLIVIAGKYQFSPKLPFVPGKGPAGTVTKTGSAVTQLKVGDRVLAMVEQGGYGQEVAAPESQCYRLPDELSFVDAASMSLVYDTSWFALRDRARIAKGETVLILGATGGVGFASAMLAKAMGAKVLVGFADRAKLDLFEALQPDGVVDLSQPDLHNSLRQQVFEQTSGNGVDVVIDPLGGDFFDAALRAVAWRGRLVTIGFAGGRIPTLKVNYLLLKNIEVSGLQVSDYRKRMPMKVRECFEEIFDLYRQGLVRPAPPIVRPLDEFADALASVRDRRVRGRVVLVP